MPKYTRYIGRHMRRSVCAAQFVGPIQLRMCSSSSHSSHMGAHINENEKHKQINTRNNGHHYHFRLFVFIFIMTVVVVVVVVEGS